MFIQLLLKRLDTISGNKSKKADHIMHLSDCNKAAQYMKDYFQKVSEETYINFWEKTQHSNRERKAEP